MTEPTAELAAQEKTQRLLELAALIRVQLRERFGRWSDDDPIMVALDTIASRPAVGEGLRAALEQGVLLPGPEGDGWDEEVRMTKRDLHLLLNRHAVSRVNAALNDWFAATPAGPEAIDVERLARALNASVGTDGWLHLTPPNAVDEWRENARIIAAEYARLSKPAQRETPEGANDG